MSPKRISGLFDRFEDVVFLRGTPHRFLLLTIVASHYSCHVADSALQAAPLWRRPVLFGEERSPLMNIGNLSDLRRWLNDAGTQWLNSSQDDQQPEEPSVGAIWSKASPDIERALAVYNKIEDPSIPDSRWNPFAESKATCQQDLDKILDVLLAVLDDCGAVTYRQRIKELQKRIISSRERIGELQEKLLFARLSHLRVLRMVSRYQAVNHYGTTSQTKRTHSTEYPAD
jgi:hypothetical protein